MHSAEARARAIRGMYAGSLTLALYVGATEVQGSGYTRQAVEAAFNGPIFSNANEVRFGPFDAALASAPDAWAIFADGVEINRGVVASRGDGARRLPPERGEVSFFPAGEFVDEMGA